MTEFPDDALDSGRALAGDGGPFVPFLTPGERVDLGPAGSLRQRLDRLLAARNPTRRRWALGVQAGAVVLLLLVLAFRPGPTGVTALAVLVAVVAFVIGIKLREGPRWLFPSRRSPLQQLVEQVRSEKTTAKVLDGLVAVDAAWMVLHDRLLPGTEHRLAHVLVGPIGVVIVGELPPHTTPSVREGVVFVGDHPAPELISTRWWESDQLHAHLGDVVDWWQGPVIPMAVVTATTKASVPPQLEGVATRTLAGVVPYLRSLPAPLGEWAVRDLADALRQACPPAGTGDPLAL